MSPIKKDVYAIITDRIIAILEAGTVPWRKPWNAAAGAPANFVTKKAYRGINTFLLSASCHACPYFLTFKQALDLGGNVKKGEKGMPVVFWNWVESETEVDARGNKKKMPFLRYYTVFNLEQCEGIEWVAPETVARPAFAAIEEAESIVKGMNNAPTLSHGGNVACYIPSRDAVNMPARESFDTPENYYHTLFHELVHSTGHTSRLSRIGIADVSPFGSPTYTREELVAEMGAAFLSGCAGVQHSMEQSAAYVQSWIKVIKGDVKLVVTAAAQGQKASDYILGTTFNAE